MYSVYCMLKKLKHIITTTVQCNVQCTMYILLVPTRIWFRFILCYKYCFSGLVVVVLLYLYTVLV